MRHLLFSLTLLLGFLFVTSAQQGFLDPNKLTLSGRSVTTTNYPNADDVMIDDVIKVEYAPNGCAVTWDDTAIKVLTEEGRRDNRVLRFHYCQSYEKLTLVLLQTITEDGKVTDLNIDEVTAVMTDRSQMSSNIYDPNDKILQARIPDLQLNMIVRYLVRREIFKPRVPNTFSDYQVFEYSSPILHSFYQIRAPRELPLQKHEILSPFEDTLEYMSEETPEGIVHTWEVKQVPQALPEPQMPKMYTCVQRVLVSTIPTWEEVSKWYWNLCLPHLKTNEEIEKKVLELTKDCHDDTQKIRSIFRFISQEIRYMGETTETEAPGYEPHDVTQTFGKRHGVCRDKAALLCAMLRFAGFNAYPVLISVGPLKDKEVPQPYFNHAITCVENEGSYTLMDSTNENTVELFPAYLANCSYLVARPEGEDLQTSPVPPSSANSLTIDSTSYLDEHGTLIGNTTMHFKGINDTIYRSFFAGNTPDDIKNYLEKVVNSTIPGALLKNYELSPKDMMETDTEITLKLTYSAPNYVSGNDELSFLHIPSFQKKFGIHNFIIGDASLDKRRFPFQCRYKCAVHEKNSIHCAAKWGTPESIPEFKEIDCNTMKYKKELQLYGNNNLNYTSDMQIETIMFSPEEYAELKENLKIIEYNAKKMPVLRRKQEIVEPENEPDIVKLSETTDITLQSACTWTEKHYVKFQIMSYGGKKDYSELKLQFIPEFEDVKLEFAKVHNGETCTELNLAENKLMDAGWNGSAQRYPKGHTLVANLPAVEIGSIIEYQYTYVRKQGDIPFSFVTSFRETAPVLHRSVTISHHTSIPIAINLSQNGTFMPKGTDNVKYEKKEAKGIVQHSWTCTNQKPFSPEANLPRLRYILPSLCVTTGNWKNYCAQMKKAIESKTHATPAIQKIVEEMKGMDDLKKARAIHDMVARSIRSAGPEFHRLSLDTISEAGATLTDGYGNALDRAVLIYTLLAFNGFKPELILAQGSLCSEKVENELISFFAPTLFASPIVRVKCDGKWIWFNESTQYAEPGTCGYENHKALGMDGKIFTIEVPDKYKSRTYTQMHIRLFPNGDARIEVKDTFYGTSYNSLNKKISEQTKEDRRRYHLSLLDSLSATATADGDLITNVKSYPAVIYYAANVKNLATSQGDLLYLTCPIEGVFSAPQNKRVLPFEYTGKATSQTDVLIDLPDDYAKINYISPSKKFILPEETYTYLFKSSSTKNSITISTVLNANPFLLSASRYEGLQSVLRQIVSPALNTIILSK
ncbi:MAG: DUF3857 domain-containing protein [Victivallales bacterium]|nr:DUF3857 domain-containing protein [Victivallales bacterium]